MTGVVVGWYNIKILPYFQLALASRVGNWRVTKQVRLQLPPRPTQHAVFPHYAVLTCIIHEGENSNRIK